MVIPEPEDPGGSLQEPWDRPVSFEPGMLLSWRAQQGQMGRKNPCVQALSPLIGQCRFRKTLPPRSARVPLWPCVILPTHQAALSYLPAGQAHTFLLDPIFWEELLHLIPSLPLNCVCSHGLEEAFPQPP